MAYCDRLTCYRCPCSPHVETLLERLAPLQQTLVANDSQRDTTFRLSRDATRQLDIALYHLHQAPSVDYASVVARALETVRRSMPPVPVDEYSGEEEQSEGESGSWAVMQRFVQICAFAKFRESKLTTIVTMQELQAQLGSITLTDEVYLGGVMAFTEDLNQLAVRSRSLATAVQCREICNGLWSQLQLYDFRNSWLRRRYDGIKYKTKDLEELCFSLANKEGSPGPAVPVSIPADDLEAIRERMKQYDLKREEVIKACRPIQKNAKNSIYRLLSGNMEEADKLLKSAQADAAKLHATFIADNPSLRWGSYSNGLEEYVEGYLLQQWLLTGQVCGPESFQKMKLEPQEYLGGLGDLSGELGRWGTNNATRGDAGALQRALDTVLEIEGCMLSLTLPRFLGAKRKLVTMTARKLEKQSLELFLSGRGMREATDKKTE